MAKHDSSDSEPEESETLENSSSEEERGPIDGQNKGISEYEKQRLSRIADNRARMEALGLPKMASSLMGSAQNLRKRKGKRKIVDDDEDYTPMDDGNDDDGDDHDLDDEDEEFLGNEASGSRKRKVKNKDSKHNTKVPVQKHLGSSGYVDDDDELMQAIALSLQDSAEISGLAHGGPSQCPGAHVVDAPPSKRKGNAHIQEDTGRRKRNKLFTSRVQMTEDEVVLHFFQFDEAGTGSITITDLRRVVVAHDFLWTDKDLADMIHCFDSDGDGKINLDDFQKIASRCNMIKGSEHS